MKKRILPMACAAVVIMASTGLAMASPRPVSADIGCPQFSYQSDVTAVTDALGGAYGLVNDGEPCVAGRGGAPLRESTPNRPERLGGTSIRDDLPDGVQELEVELDGSVFGVGLKENVSFGPDNHYSVRLTGIEDPIAEVRNRQCFGQESRDLFNTFLPVGTSVWLERDATKDVEQSIGDSQNAVGYIWIQRDDDRFQMVNLALVEQGAVVVSITPPNERYAGDLRAAQRNAIQDGEGLWSECRNEDEPATNGSAADDADSISSPVADCSAFASYDIAQDYYALHPDEQQVIDPDTDGLACEVYFGRG